MSNSEKQKSEISFLAEQLIFLSVLCFMSWFFYGIRAVAVLATAVFVSLFCDIACIMLLKKKLSAADAMTSIVGGLVFALMLPASVPYYIAASGAAFASIVVRQVFGGRGHAIFNSSAAAFAFVSICWPTAVLQYPKPGTAIGLTAVTDTLYPSLTYTLFTSNAPNVTDIEFAIGQFCGGMGTTHWIILTVAVIFMMIMRTVSPFTFFGALGTIMLYSAFFPQLGSGAADSLLFEYSAGSLLFSLIFMACDYSLLPRAKLSRFVYGVLIGVAALVFRRYARVENPVVFAVLIINPLTIALDDYELRIKRHAALLFEKLCIRFPAVGYFFEKISAGRAAGKENSDEE